MTSAQPLGEVDRLIEESSRRSLALYLWQIGSLQVSFNPPFTLVSGGLSPIYLDCRRIISSVEAVDLFQYASRALLSRNRVVFDCLAGGETAGIPLAAFLASALGRPMVYVRKSKKRHGLRGSIEGILEPGQRVLLVDDLMTDGGSKLGFIETLRAAGAEVTDILVLFDRGQGGTEALAMHSVRLHALVTMSTMLKLGREIGLLLGSELESLEHYLSNPKSWSPPTGI